MSCPPCVFLWASPLRLISFNVLILQLKWFTFTPSFTVEKKNSPIVLTQQLVISQDTAFTEEVREKAHRSFQVWMEPISKLTGGAAALSQETARYLLVSLISRLGSSAYSGEWVLSDTCAECRSALKVYETLISAPSPLRTLRLWRRSPDERKRRRHRQPAHVRWRVGLPDHVWVCVWAAAENSLPAIL